jgi:hypothetical protein
MFWASAMLLTTTAVISIIALEIIAFCFIGNLLRHHDGLIPDTLYAKYSFDTGAFSMNFTSHIGAILPRNQQHQKSVQSTYITGDGRLAGCSFINWHNLLKSLTGDFHNWPPVRI